MATQVVRADEVRVGDVYLGLVVAQSRIIRSSGRIILYHEKGSWHSLASYELVQVLR